MPHIIRFLSLLIASCMIASCGFDKDNTPPPSVLAPIDSTIAIKPLWKSQVGSGASPQNVTLRPSLDHSILYAASPSGMISALQASTGKIKWQTNIHLPITAGVAATEHQVIAVAQAGVVIALNTATGEIQWKMPLDADIIAAPVATTDIIIVKTMNGDVCALSTTDGHLLWRHSEAEPSLILHAASAPLISHSSVVAGLANGHLLRLNLKTGYVEWSHDIATPEGSASLQRMVDIDADPVIKGNALYIATYQGDITVLNAQTGEAMWSHPFSTHSDLAVDEQRVYASNTDDNVFAFDKAQGQIKWRQTALAYRTLSGPLVLQKGLVMGDKQGYLHLLNKQNGKLIGRLLVGNSPILATPVSQDGITFYVLTQDGLLAAYSAS